MISKKDFLKGLEYLENAFGYKVGEKQFGIYYENLKDVFTADQFAIAIKSVVVNETRFPAIATLLKWAPRKREVVI